MECPVCMEGYSGEADRLPKFIGCGHMACVSCLRRQRNCPQCRKEFAGPADALVTVFDAIRGRDSLDTPSGWWCTECLSAASAQCRDNHPIIRVQVALRRQAAKLAPLASEAVRGLEDAVQAAAEEPARLALQLLADGDAPAECELTVRRGGSAVGAQWRLEEGGAADGLDRALLCKLAAAGRLRKLADPEVQPDATVRDDSIIPEILVWHLVNSGSNQDLDEKETLLQRVLRHGVRRIKGLHCSRDPIWSLKLLQAATASLEELQLYYVRSEHLLAAHSAPRLRRLHVHVCNYTGDLSVDGRPIMLPALAAPSSLQWLKVYSLPRATLESLLRAHAASLRTLVLSVGTPGRDKDWPFSCPDLDAMLGGCGLAALTKLQLRRVNATHTKQSCKKQIQALRRVLPASTVECMTCDGCEEELF